MYLRVRSLGLLIFPKPPSSSIAQEFAHHDTHGRGSTPKKVNRIASYLHSIPQGGMQILRRISIRVSNWTSMRVSRNTELHCPGSVPPKGLMTSGCREGWVVGMEEKEQRPPIFLFYAGSGASLCLECRAERAGVKVAGPLKRGSEGRPVAHRHGEIDPWLSCRRPRVKQTFLI